MTLFSGLKHQRFLRQDYDNARICSVWEGKFMNLFHLRLSSYQCPVNLGFAYRNLNYFR
jgi:hypothetical protein